MSAAGRELAASVRLLVLDVDGVLTDGRLWFGPDGEALKVFHVRDGHGIKLLREAGVEVAIISGRRSRAVETRMRELGVSRVIQGADDKQSALDGLLASLGVAPAEAACLVDDLPDLPLLRTVGLPAALHLYEDLPFWKKFFDALSIRTVTSEGCSDALKEGIEGKGPYVHGDADASGFPGIKPGEVLCGWVVRYFVGKLVILIFGQLIQVEREKCGSYAKYHHQKYQPTEDTSGIASVTRHLHHLPA